MVWNVWNGLWYDVPCSIECIVGDMHCGMECIVGNMHCGLECFVVCNALWYKMHYDMVYIVT